jgi:hypothetical protein
MKLSHVERDALTCYRILKMSKYSAFNNLEFNIDFIRFYEAHLGRRSSLTDPKYSVASSSVLCPCRLVAD